RKQEAEETEDLRAPALERKRKTRSDEEIEDTMAQEMEALKDMSNMYMIQNSSLFTSEETTTSKTIDINIEDVLSTQPQAMTDRGNDNQDLHQAESEEERVGENQKMEKVPEQMIAKRSSDMTNLESNATAIFPTEEAVTVIQEQKNTEPAAAFVEKGNGPPLVLHSQDSQEPIGSKASTSASKTLETDTDMEGFTIVNYQKQSTKSKRKHYIEVMHEVHRTATRRGTVLPDAFNRLNDSGKQTTVLTLIKSYNLDLIMLQETNLYNNTTRQFLKNQWTFDLVWTKRTAILARKKEIKFEEIEIKIDDR
ncbi:5793_t:CDS:2, partial [Gigaspora rosea]